MDQPSNAPASPGPNELVVLREKLGGFLPVKVYFLDNSTKTFLCSEDDTFDHLCVAICEKFDIDHPEDAARYFGLFESTENVVTSSFAPNASPTKTLLQWGGDNARDERKKIVFMIRLFLPSLGRQESRPVIAHLRYIQAVFNVITSEHMTDPAEALELAAIQFRIKFGEATPDSNRGAGFLGARLVEFIPANMLRQRRPDFWEREIAHRASKLSATSLIALKRQYVHATEQWGRYGHTFFKCTQNHFSNIPERVHVAVSCSGVSVWSEGAQEPDVAFELSDIKRWGYHPSKHFYIEVNKQLEAGAVCMFQMHNGNEVSDLLQDYAMAILQDQDNEEQDEEDEEEEDYGDDIYGAPGAAAVANAPSSPELPSAPLSPPAPPVSNPDRHHEHDVGTDRVAQAAADGTAGGTTVTSKSLDDVVGAAAADSEMAKERAATTVQSFFRGFRIRRDLYALEEDLAIVRIQAVFRGHSQRAKEA